MYLCQDSISSSIDSMYLHSVLQNLVVVSAVYHYLANFNLVTWEAIGTQSDHHLASFAP